jgi:hypothetical protein
MTGVRTGRDGFTGSPITRWCGTCEDYMVPHDSGRCLWCDAGVSKKAKKPLADPSYRNKVRRDVTLDPPIVELHDRGLSLGRIAEQLGLGRSGVKYRLRKIEAEALAAAA